MDEQTPPRERIQVIFSAKLIEKRIDEIAPHYWRHGHVVAVLKSRFVFAADRLRAR